MKIVESLIAIWLVAMIFMGIDVMDQKPPLKPEPQPCLEKTAVVSGCTDTFTTRCKTDLDGYRCLFGGKLVRVQFVAEIGE